MSETIVRCLLLLILFLTGCAKFVANPRLDRVTGHGYRFENLELGENNTEEVFVVLSLSGGGTRAAALSYGVMEQLRATTLDGDGRTLLTELDVISSVSGGSFAAAYYGLFREEAFFANFKTDVLQQKIQSRLIRSVLLPWNWPRLWSPRFGRSDLVNRYYHRKLFGEKTFSDLPLRRPFVILNASDMTLGAQFSFTQPDFDRLCSDLSSVQVSRAVLSSSAFPGAFTPVTWVNQAKSACDYRRPEWVTLSLGEDELCREDPDCVGDLVNNPRRFNEARNWKAYEDARDKPFIHLVDGGVSDNIGLRGPIAALTGSDGPWSVVRNIRERGIKHVVVIVVDAKPRGRSKLDRKASPPGILSVMAAAATRPMANYSLDTVELLRNRFGDWKKEMKTFEGTRRLCAGDPEPCAVTSRDACYSRFRVNDMFRPPDPELYHIHVQFDAIKDPILRQELQEMPTSLQLPSEALDKLTRAGATLLAESTEFQRLVRNLRE